jgi:hypothetical protein
VYYQLEWDQGMDIWTVITDEASQGTSLFKSFTPTPKFESGIIVKFRLTAKNGVGFGI